MLQYKAMLTLLTAFEANPRGQPAKFNDIRMLDIFKAHQCISFNGQIKWIQARGNDPLNSLPMREHSVALHRPDVQADCVVLDHQSLLTLHHI